MFNKDFDINQNYFYMPFGPITFIKSKAKHLKASLLQSIKFAQGVYVQKTKKTVWRSCWLYDTGWGQPIGFERIPPLSFCQLLQLALTSDGNTTKLSIEDEESNKYGAVAIIMERHITELLEFLKDNIDNDELWSNKLICSNLKAFCFDPRKEMQGGAIGNRTYEEIFKEYPLWNTMSDIIKAKVYSN